MSGLVAWCGFLGAWLLVAGPVYQAAVELDDADQRRDELMTAARSVDRPTGVSGWWWLLPPVGYVLHRRRDRAFRAAVLRALDARQVQQLVEFHNKATGWFFVAAGAFLIAVKETWELHEHEEWPLAVFWVVVVLMPFVAAAYTAIRTGRGDRLVAGARGDAG